MTEALTGNPHFSAYFPTFSEKALLAPLLFMVFLDNICIYSTNFHYVVYSEKEY